MILVRQKIKQKQKGFVFSLDAIFAIITAFFLIFLIFNNILKEPSVPPVQIQRQGMDVLTVIDNLNKFYSPETTFAETSDSVCMRLEVFNGTSSTADSIFVKHGCPSSDTDEHIIWRTSTFGNRFKTAKLAVWVKK